MFGQILLPFGLLVFVEAPSVGAPEFPFDLDPLVKP